MPTVAECRIYKDGFDCSKSLSGQENRLIDNSTWIDDLTGESITDVKLNYGTKYWIVFVADLCWDLSHGIFQYKKINENGACIQPVNTRSGENANDFYQYYDNDDGCLHTGNNNYTGNGVNFGRKRMGTCGINSTDEYHYGLFAMSIVINTTCLPGLLPGINPVNIFLYSNSGTGSRTIYMTGPSLPTLTAELTGATTQYKQLLTRIYGLQKQNNNLSKQITDLSIKKTNVSTRINNLKTKKSDLAKRITDLVTLINDFTGKSSINNSSNRNVAILNRLQNLQPNNKRVDHQRSFGNNIQFGFYIR